MGPSCATGLPFSYRLLFPLPLLHSVFLCVQGFPFSVFLFKFPLLPFLFSPVDFLHVDARAVEQHPFLYGPLAFLQAPSRPSRSFLLSVAGSLRRYFVFSTALLFFWRNPLLTFSSGLLFFSPLDILYLIRAWTRTPMFLLMDLTVFPL